MCLLFTYCIHLDAGLGGNLLLRVLVGDGWILLGLYPLLLGILEYPELGGAKHQSVIVLEFSLPGDGVPIDQDPGNYYVKRENLNAPCHLQSLSPGFMKTW